MNAALALLSAALLSATGMTDAEVRAHVEAMLGAIDRPIPAERWKALGPVAATVLAEVAASGDEAPSRRSAALGALASVDPARAEPLARALVDSDGAPLPVRETAVRVLGRTLPPTRLHSALAPVLRAAPDAALRAVAAETLARHAPGSACAEVMDQVSLEPAASRVAFERAVARCSGR
jgi:HEAT repeat protein